MHALSADDAELDVAVPQESEQPVDEPPQRATVVSRLREG
jgi:hypothetical protein